MRAGTPGETRVQRATRRHARGVVAFAAAVATAAGAVAIGDGGDTSSVSATSNTISLSMSVEPGQPVPIELLTEDAAEELYADGFYGQGVDVALIDSGVAPVAGLDQPGKLLYGPDLSNEGGLDNLANLDTYGHGTHLAGIIAGDDGDRVAGVAPASRIVSVKVAGATGETDIAQVIAGIDWVIEHKDDPGLNIRVLNLSLGVGGLATTAGDPLSAAVERAWDAGIVVVAAAGNRGNDAPGIDSPALSPYVVAVGGTESYDSEGEGDVVASWSSGGNAFRSPDVVAPGRSILSFRVPGSMLDQLHPEAAVGERYFRGSGTSQSAAVVSGFTALLLSADPSMTPDQVKFLYRRFADDLVPDIRLDGEGRIDLDDSFEERHDKVQAHPQAHPRALPVACWFRFRPINRTTVWSTTKLQEPMLVDSTVQPVDDGFVLGDVDADVAQELDDALTNDEVLLDPQAASTDVVEKSMSDAYSAFSSSAFLPLSPVVGTPCGDTWSGGSWNGATWSGGTWNGATWSGATWSGATWSGGVWSGATWSGATWSGATWSGATWSGATWSGATWSGATWSGATWSSKANGGEG